MTSLTAAYTFNDGTGSIYDYSGNKVTLTPGVGSMVVSATTSPVGVGYDCELTQSASGSFGPISSYTGLTVFAYFKYNGSSGNIIRYASGFSLDINSSFKVEWSVWDSSATQYTATSSAALTPGNWYTITGTWDATAQKVYLYINGALVANHDMPNPISTTTSSLILRASGTFTTSLLNTLEIRNATFNLAQIQQLEASPGGALYAAVNTFAVGDVIGDELQSNQAIVTWVADQSGFYAYPITLFAGGEYSRYGNIYNTNRQYLMLVSNDFDGNGNAQHQILFPITCFADYASPANKLAIDFTGITFPKGSFVQGQTGLSQISMNGSGISTADGNIIITTDGGVGTTPSLELQNSGLFQIAGTSQIFWYNTSGNTLELDSSLLTANYSVQFPNKTGTQVLAMISDLNAAILGLQLKPTADAATTTALPTNTYNNGSLGVGATLVGVATTALPSIDGVAPFVGMIVLVKNEMTTANNGLYAVTDIGGSGHSYILTRHTEMNLASEFNGSLIPVDNEGSTNANTIWIMGYVSPFTVGTSVVTFSQVGGTAYTSGTGITISGTAISLASGVCTPGTYQSVTVDTYGRVTAGSALTNNYQTVQYNASSLTQRAKLNFTKDFNVTDDSGNGSTDIRLRGKSKLYQFYNY